MGYFEFFFFLYRSSILQASLIQVETPSLGKTNLFNTNHTPKMMINQSKSLSILFPNFKVAFIYQNFGDKSKPDALTFGGCFFRVR